MSESRQFALSTPPEIPGCAVPLLFETGIEEAPYGLAGTGFLAIYRERLFLITAEHCIRPEQYNHLRLPLTEQSAEVARLLEFFSTYTPSEGGGREPKDVAFFTVAHEEPALSILAAKAVHLPLTFAFEEIRDRLREQNVGILLVVSGYPMTGTNTAVDYEDRHLVTQGARLVGDFEATWTDSPDLHRMRFREPSPITALNGMSGSPVFGVTRFPPTSGELVYFLVGMLLMGTFPIANFVSVGTIRAALDEGLRREAFERNEPAS